MKKILLTCFVVLSAIAFGQTRAVKINPFAILGGTDFITYEHGITSNSSLGLGVGFNSYSVNDFKYTSAGVSGFYRYYFKNEAIKGWYAGPFIGYLSGKVNYDSSNSESTKYHTFKVGAKAGYQWIWSSGFTLDLNAGYGYRTVNYDNKNTVDNDLQGSAMIPNFGLGLGYAF